MKVLTEYLKFHTKTHRAYVHLTPQVEEIVRKSGVNEGMVLVSAMHITAGVYVNDNESGLIEDIDQWLERLAPFRKNYKHHETGEDNGDSHLKALLIHHEVIVPITDGKLDLGTWQRIFYAEFDGQCAVVRYPFFYWRSARCGEGSSCCLLEGPRTRTIGCFQAASC